VSAVRDPGLQEALKDALQQRPIMDAVCFICGCFGWCLEHSSISTGNHGEVEKRTIVTTRDASGNIVTTQESEMVEKCSSEDTDLECDVLCSGEFKRLFSLKSMLNHLAEYTEDEWEEEEQVVWMNEQMAKDSP
jgi:hypothetical protein